MNLPGLFAATTLAFSLFGFARYFGPVAAEGLWALFLLSVLTASCAGFGAKAMGWLGLSPAAGLEKMAAASALGLGALSWGLFFLAAGGGLTPIAGSGLVGAFFLAGFGELRRIGAGLKLERGSIDHPAAAAGLGLALLLPLWACFVPPHQYDSLVYHLALPEAYVRAGGFVTLKHLLFSHFPQNAELLFSLALLWRSDLLAQMIMWLASVLSVLWVFAVARRELGFAAWLASLLLATHTSFMLMASTTYVEPLLMLWISASAFSFMRWRSGEEGSSGWLKLAAIFAGLALGTKYYAGIAAAVLALFLGLRVLSSAESERGKRVRELVLFTVLTTAVFLPWLIKNAVEVGNPVFPFLYKWFPMTGTGWNAQTAAGYFDVMVEYGHTNSLLNDFLSLPILLLRNSLRFGGGMDVLGDLGWELTFWCLPLAVWAAWGKLELRRLLVFAVCYFSLWFLTGVVLRFLVVLAPILCLLAAAGLQRLWGRLNGPGRTALATAVSLLSAAHLGLFFFVHAVFGSEKALLGLETREEFLSRRLDYYPCARYAAGQLGQNDKILIVGEQRAYYVGQNIVATTVHAPNPFITWANESSSPTDLARRLAQEGFTHVLAVPAEAKRLGPALGEFTPRGQKNWADLHLGMLKPVREERACVLFKIDLKTEPQ